MHVKATLRQLGKTDLTEHEVKRCRAVARGRHWDVWEEHILWWSGDQMNWQPLVEDLAPHRRRWLIVDSEEGCAVALIWGVGDGFVLPAPGGRAEATPERDRV